MVSALLCDVKGNIFRWYLMLTYIGLGIYSSLLIFHQIRGYLAGFGLVVPAQMGLPVCWTARPHFRRKLGTFYRPKDRKCRLCVTSWQFRHIFLSPHCLKMRYMWLGHTVTRTTCEQMLANTGVSIN